MSKSAYVIGLALIASLAIVGCSTAKAPADAAIKAAEDALNAARPEAAKFVPDQLASLEATLQSAKDNFQKGEYQAALTAAQDLPDKIKDLAAAASAKKDQLMKSWADLSGGLPKMIEAVQSRMGILEKSRRLPANLDKAKFEEAKSSLATVTQSWSDATAAFGSGNLTDAVAKAQSVKDKTTGIMELLGMQPPPAAAK
jgi:hypothetical protein